MKRLLLSGLMGLAMLPQAGVAADAFYINNGTVLNPQVDAINFVNKGLFQASGSLPYETFSTLNYTNKVGTFSGSGTMVGSPGFRFDTCSSATGMRTMASSFFNDNGAVVQANDPFASGFCIVSPVGPSYVLVSATNIMVKAGTSGTPKASLIVGPNGGLELSGKNVDLTRSGLEVLPVWDTPLGVWIINDTNYIPDIAINDLYWGRTNFNEEYRLNSAALWNGSTARAPGVAYPRVLPRGASGFSLPNPVADSYFNVPPGGMMTVTITNQSGEEEEVLLATNVAKGAIFVAAPAGCSVETGFSGGYNTADTGLETAGVLLSIQFSNVVTTQMEPAYIYIDDQLASGGTTGILANTIGCPATTALPANYLVTRMPFYPGDFGNYGYPPDDFFLVSGNEDPLILRDGVTNAILQAGELAAYAAYLDNVVSRPLPVSGGTVTNLPGRIRISASTLDMTRTRMRAEGEIIIQTSHLISSTNTVIDCEHLSFNLASTNGNLKVQNLSKDTVNRLTGSIRLWSAVWSNTAEVVLDSWAVDEEGNAEPAPATNMVNLVFHAFMVDARALQTTLPVTVHSVVTHSTNVVVSDNMTLGESAVFDGRSLTFDGNVTVPGVVPVVNPIIGYAPPGEPFRDWTFANVPNLLYFTNHGTFSIANDAHFGDDRAAPYSAFVNTGTVSAASIALNSVYFENRGSLSSVGPLFMQSTSAKLESGSSYSGGDSQFVSGSLKINNYQMAVNGGLYITATGSLFDAGGSSSNVLSVLNGFHLQNKPPTGDLLGTTIETMAPDVPSIWLEHTWAGADRGPNATGYTNNTALGTLELSAQSLDPFFYFAGTGVQNGLYVDVLDLADLGTNYQSWIAIDPSLVIYYAAAKLGFTPPPTNAIPQQPEEFLDGQFEGRLRWVRSFAGPNSSIAVLVNGQTVMVNRALRNSRLIDSNTNGVPNYYDPYPFSVGGVTLTASLVQTNPPTSSAVTISWRAAPSKVYQVEWTSDASLKNWQPLLRYTNSALTNRVVSVSDTNAPAGAARRFYRVGFSP